MEFKATGTRRYGKRFTTAAAIAVAVCFVSVFTKRHKILIFVFQNINTTLTISTIFQIKFCIIINAWIIFMYLKII